jgi:hypothetical protein
MNMNSLNVLELALVVAAKNHNPAVLNPDFLRYGGIVPQDWVVGRPPVYTGQMTQVLYQNGVSFVAQTDRIMFIEALNDKSVADAEIATIAQKYTQTMPHADYQAVGINLRGYVSFPSAEAVEHYLNNSLLAPGSWQNFGGATVRPTLNFAYKLAQSLLTVNISEATLQFPEQDAQSVALFTGNFAYDLTEADEAGRLARLAEIIQLWQNDLNTFQELVNQHLLNPVTTPMPLFSSENLMAGVA